MDLLDKILYKVDKWVDECESFTELLTYLMITANFLFVFVVLASALVETVVSFLLGG